MDFDIFSCLFLKLDLGGVMELASHVPPLLSGLLVTDTSVRRTSPLIPSPGDDDK